MRFVTWADWSNTGVCDSLLGVDGLLGHPDLQAKICFAYFLLFLGVSFCCTILCEEPFGLACVAYVGVVV